MNSINSFEKDDLDKGTSKAKIKRSSMREVLTVCPLCFSVTKISNADIFTKDYACTNEKCNWTGTLAIEVNKEDYREFVEKQEESKQK